MVGMAENLNVCVTLKLRCGLKKNGDKSCVGGNDLEMIFKQKPFFKRSDFLATFSLCCGNFILAATAFMYTYGRHVNSRLT